ncbi:efflux RND transporter permease subunit [Pseudemcibacter aquimaris]|uniref:efflux RND transporter permease subunit n=1 Tax=Pseudemcibacter aquimaris TaxID=2857064 RepID=UPI00202B5BB7|nr:efflux RND transporter permease subunit [Pseudemcibacter aquimaris]MCC3859836.1 efflux RND transporter permease subunit [Pseudemcibacter aquimaris]WDU57168.1 efflux RND transporter permease subunit [Pseudemcibacter aquimaris]
MWSNLFYKNKRLTALVLGFIFVAGLSALSSIPRQEDPLIAHRFDVVVTTFPGASAERVDALITEKIEASLARVDEIREVNSTSRAGVSNISVELEEDIPRDELENIWSKVRDKLDDAVPYLPAGASKPRMLDRESPVYTFMVGFTWDNETEDPQLDILGRFGREFERALAPISGTVDTGVFGEPSEEVLVDIDPDALASVGMTISQVSAAIATSDSKIPAGQVRARYNDLLVEVSGELKSEDRVRSIILKQLDSGEFLRVGDIATVKKTVREPSTANALINGKRAVIVGAKVDQNVRVDQWAAKMYAATELYRDVMPEGVTMEVIFSQDSYVTDRLSTLLGNIIISCIIIISVMIFMMGWRSAILVATSLPLTILMVMTIFNLMDVNLHQMSIGGIIIALGLLIDNAIVAIDKYKFSRSQGIDVPTSISKMAKHLIIPLLASTATTSLTFMPIVLAPGPTGEFIGTIGMAVIFSLASSLFLALTIIPALAGYLDKNDFFKGSAEPENGVTDVKDILANGYINVPLRERYRNALSWCLDHPKKAALISISLPLLGFILASTLIQQFFPPGDRDQFQVQLKMPSTASLEETTRQVSKVREVFARYPEITDDVWVIGENPPGVYYNTFLANDGVSSFAGGFVTTGSPDETRAILPQLQIDLINEVPDAMVLALPFEQGPPFEAPVEVLIYGQDLNVLSNQAEEIRRILATSKGVSYTQVKSDFSQKKLMFIPNEEAAQVAGLKLNDVAQQLNNALEGQVGGSVLEGTEELPVRVRYGNENRTDLDFIMNNSVVSANGAVAVANGDRAGIPLSSLGRMEVVPTISTIVRRDSRRMNVVQAYVHPYSLPGATLLDLRARLDAAGFELPAGYEMAWGGEEEKRARSEGGLFSTVLPLMVIMVGILVLAFNSFTSALIIGGVAFFSAGLALLSLWLFGFTMGFMGIMGTMGLIGLAINDSIVVLAALRANENARNADKAAIVQVTINSTRHIVSTTFTTIGGFLPLILFSDAMWPPLATAIAGGMVGATLLALIFVPSLYYLRVRRRVNKLAAEGGTVLPLERAAE